MREHLFFDSLSPGEWVHLTRPNLERAKKFLWEYKSNLGPWTQFWLDPDSGQPVDENFNRIEGWTAGLTHIRLAHPIDIDNLEGWQELFGDFEIAQPFPQLDRPICSHKYPKEWVGTGHKRPKFRTEFLVAYLQRRGWRWDERRNQVISSAGFRNLGSLRIAPGFYHHGKNTAHPYYFYGQPDRKEWQEIIRVLSQGSPTARGYSELGYEVELLLSKRAA